MTDPQSNPNPFSTPSLPPQPGQPGHPYNNPPGYQPGAGYVEQVRVVSILMIVLGALEIVSGLASSAVAVFGIAVGGPNDEDAIIVVLFYGAIGLAFLIAGPIRLIAGIQGLKFKGWTLGLISHFLGILTLLSCQCSLLAIGLGIFGLIVYLQPSVKQAFAMRKDGKSAEQIVAYFRQMRFPY